MIVEHYWYVNYCTYHTFTKVIEKLRFCDMTLRFFSHQAKFRKLAIQKWVICWWNKARPRTTEVLLIPLVFQDFHERDVRWWHQPEEGLAYIYCL